MTSGQFFQTAKFFNAKIFFFCKFKIAIFFVENILKIVTLAPQILEQDELPRRRVRQRQAHGHPHLLARAG
jgi:hypothetical protein